MLYCPKCHVQIRTNHSKCPLCQGVLTGEAQKEDEIFPVLEKKKSLYGLLRQVITFVTVLVSIISIALNWILTPDKWWSFYVVAAAWCTFVVLIIGIAKRKNLMKNVMWQLCVVELFMALWDLATGWNGWFLDYFFPLGILFALSTLIFLSFFQKMDSTEYMIYILISCCMGIVPLVLLLAGVVGERIPSIVCGGICLIVVSALGIFQRQAVVNEIGKKFHI